MLDFTPEDLVALPQGSAEWSVAWDGEPVLDDWLLFNLLAVSKKKPVLETNGPAGPRGLVEGAFEPERVAGYCAAG